MYLINNNIIKLRFTDIKLLKTEVALFKTDYRLNTLPVVRFLAMIMMFCSFTINTNAQDCSGCGAVTTIDIDLTSTSDTVWISPPSIRNGQCCQGIGTETCIRFNIKTHAQSAFLNFALDTINVVPGSMYSVDCGVPQALGQLTSITGGNSICIVYCNSDADILRYKITVNSLPKVNAGNDSTICQDPTSFKLHGTISGAKTGIFWKSLGSGSFSDITDLNTQYTPSQADTAAGFVILVLSSNAIGSSPSVTDTVVYTLSHQLLPSASFTTDKNLFCSPTTVNFSTTTVANSYYWDFGDGTSGYGAQNTSHVYNNKTTDDVSYTASLTVTSAQNCSNRSQTTITAHPYLKAQVSTVTGSGCSPFTATILNKSINALTYKWDYGDGTSDNNPAASFTHDYTNTTSTQITRTIFLTITNKEGCESKYNVPVNIFPKVVSQFTQNTISGCSPLQTTFTNLSTNAQIFAWDFGDGFTSADENPIHPYYNTSPSAQTFWVSLISKSSYGCTDTAKQISIYVINSPDPYFETDHDVGCSPLTIKPKNVIATTTSYGTLHYVWNFGDGTSESDTIGTFTHLYTNNTSSQVIRTIGLSITNDEGCTTSFSQHVNIFPEVKALFSQNKTTGCAPVDVTFINQSVNAQFYTWDFNGDSTTNEPNPSYSFTNNASQPKTFRVSLKSESVYGCIDTMGVDIIANQNPQALFTTDISKACSPVDVTLSNLSFNADSYQWDFGDGTSSTNSTPAFNHTYTNTTTTTKTFTIKLTASTKEGCSHQTTRTITIYPHVTASFTDNTKSGCTPLTVLFSNKSTNADTYFWDFGDGTTSTNVNQTHSFNNNGNTTDTKTVRLIASSNDGCSDTTTDLISIFPPSIADFELDQITACAPFIETITNKSINASTYQWNFGDGTTDTKSDNIITHNFNNPAAFKVSRTVSLTVTSNDGCTQSTSKILEVYPEVKALFSINKSTGCSPLNVAFTNNSTNTQSYIWDFGDNTNSILYNPSHSYHNNTSTTQTYNVVLISQSTYGCSDTSSATTITVYNNPVAKILTDTTQACSPATFIISNQSEHALNFSWNFGDGTTGTQSTPSFSHSYTNSTALPITRTISVTVTSSDGCTHNNNVSVTIYPKVTALFTPNIQYGCSPVAIHFTNKSTNAQNFIWDFGDSNTSNATDPSHIYENNSSASNTFWTKLTASSTYGCADTSSLVPITADYIPIADFSTDKDVACSPATFFITNQSPSLLTYTWNFGDGANVNIASSTFTHNYINATNILLSKTIFLTVTSNNACTNTYSKTVNIYPKVTAQFTSDKMNGCTPLVVLFTNKSINADSYSWIFGDGSTAASTNISHTYNNPTNGVMQESVQLIATSNFGCSDTSNLSLISIYPRSKADFSMSNQAGCSPLTVQFLNQSGNATIYTWNITNSKASSGNDDLIQTFNNTSTSNQNRTITLIANDIYNCPDTISKNITIPVVHLEKEKVVH